jgi:pSer/pThr/pTyr-binding forkhead associated (FHA) protein
MNTSGNKPCGLLILKDKTGTHTYKLEQNLYHIGRSSESNIRLTGSQISRHHSTIVKEVDSQGNTYYQIIDGNPQAKTSSINGIYVNGNKVSSHILQHNDQITFGVGVTATFFNLDKTVASQEDFVLGNQRSKGNNGVIDYDTVQVEIAQKTQLDRRKSQAK